jgi:hypothetical protein
MGAKEDQEGVNRTDVVRNGGGKTGMVGIENGMMGRGCVR